ncbi:MAG: hypothetical protein ACK4OG_00695, partial [Parvibaculum sp.]
PIDGDASRYEMLADGHAILDKDEGRVAFQPVQLIDDTPEGLWVAGLPDKVTIITVGQDYVIEGQQVEAIPANQVGAAL